MLRWIDSWGRNVFAYPIAWRCEGLHSEIASDLSDSADQWVRSDNWLNLAKIYLNTQVWLE